MQNLQDLEGIGGKIHDCLDTLERIARLHAQSIAQTDESTAQLRGNTKIMYDDCEQYKRFITGTHQNIDGCIKRHVGDIDEKLNVLDSTNCALTGTTVTRIQVIEATLTAMTVDRGGPVPPAPPGIANVAAPATFQINTPAGTAPQQAATVPEFAALDSRPPAAQAQQQAKAAAGHQAACDESPARALARLCRQRPSTHDHKDFLDVLSRSVHRTNSLKSHRRSSKVWTPFRHLHSQTGPVTIRTQVCQRGLVGKTSVLEIS